MVTAYVGAPSVGVKAGYVAGDVGAGPAYDAVGWEVGAELEQVGTWGALSQGCNFEGCARVVAVPGLVDF